MLTISEHQGRTAGDRLTVLDGQPRSHLVRAFELRRQRQTGHTPVDIDHGSEGRQLNDARVDRVL